MSITTRKGRVVYERKKHEFNMKDVIRIGKKVDLIFFKIHPDEARIFFERLAECASELEGISAESIDFGGGAFGGGGASRTFSAKIAGLPAFAGICFIIEE